MPVILSRTLQSASQHSEQRSGQKLTGIDADNVNRSRFPRYLDHLCGTTRRVTYGLAVPQCNQSDFFGAARPSHLKHPAISAFPRIDAAAFEPSRQPFLLLSWRSGRRPISSRYRERQ